jgi:hypothetical protein
LSSTIYQNYSHNITKCPFVALICIGIHNHPPPPPEKTPAGIKNNLQSLIEQAINQDNTTTSRSLLSGKILKFNKYFFIIILLIL